MAEGTSLCSQGQTKQPRSRLKQVERALIQYAHRLRTRASRKRIPEGVREPLAGEADQIKADARSLRASLTCPDDAT